MLIQLCRYIWSSCTHSNTLSFLFHTVFFFPFWGWVALLWACSCILGFLTGSQGANKTPLYLWGVGAAFRLSCRRWDETQRGHTITGCYSMNEQRPLEITSSQPGGYRRFLRTGESANLQTYRIRRDMKNNEIFLQRFCLKLRVIRVQSWGLKLIIARLKGLHCLFIIIAEAWQVFL